MRLRLRLTGIGEILTKEAQEKLDSVSEGVSTIEDITCDNGRTREQYESLGIGVPEDLIEKEKAFKNGFELDDEDYEELEYPCRIYEDEIVGYIKSDENTIIFTKTGLTFTVKETVEEIDKLIDNN